MLRGDSALGGRHDAEGGAGADLALDVDLPAVLGDNAMGHCQAQPRALGFGGEEGFEQAGHDFRGDPHARIADADRDLARLIGRRDGFDSKAQAAPECNGVGGIQQQVDEKLADLGFIGAHDQALGGLQVKVQRHPGRDHAAEECDR